MQRSGSQLVCDGVYDQMYRDHDHTYEDVTRSQYYPIFQAIVQAAKRGGMRSILEVGCGSGVLAEMLMAQGAAYAGFDISPVGVEKAKARNPGGEFFVGDATDPQSYKRTYDGILCCEVLEHIDDDLGAIAQWAPGTPVICSVPNFDYYTHVRHFKTDDEVARRYGALIGISNISHVKMPIHRVMTKAQYLNQVRWAIMGGDFKRAAGLLGINQFDWRGGWFLFEGRRR